MNSPYGVPTYKILTPDEEETFRDWARNAYAKRLYPRLDPAWHPVVRSEWRALQALEAKQARGAE